MDKMKHGMEKMNKKIHQSTTGSFSGSLRRKKPLKDPGPRGDGRTYEHDGSRSSSMDDAESFGGSVSPMPGADEDRGEFFDDGFDSRSGSNTSVEPTPPTMKRGGAESYVGFANLPNQVFRKSVKKGFQFTLMVVGESGLGKSTLLNSLFLSDIYVNRAYEDVTPPVAVSEPTTVVVPNLGRAMEVTQSTFELKEGGVRLQLSVVDTPGFGDNIDNTDCWQEVIANIEKKFEDYLNAESRVNRAVGVGGDARVHCCLYFVAPGGHGLKQLDIAFMKMLHEKVNIVPVIAKADTLTAEECAAFKTQILREIAANNINIYNFPPLGGEEDDELAALRERIPLAVVGSNTVIDVGNGRKVRGRRYPWGVVEVENIEHCDFIALRNLLIRTHMQDLIDVTNDVHYERFRSERLSVLTGGGASITSTAMNANPMEQIERERDEQETKLKRMEQEMEQVFEMKVNEKKKKLKDSEGEFSHKYEQTMKSLEQTRADLNEKRARFEKERAAFELEYNPGIAGSEKKHKKQKHLF